MPPEDMDIEEIRAMLEEEKPETMRKVPPARWTKLDTIELIVRIIVSIVTSVIVVNMVMQQRVS